MTPEVRLANRGDVDGLVALQARYYIGNLDPAEHAGGFISVLHSPGWFARVVDDGGIDLPTGPDGAMQTWTLLGIAMEALVDQFYVFDPEWSPDSIT